MQNIFGFAGEAFVRQFDQISQRRPQHGTEESPNREELREDRIDEPTHACRREDLCLHSRTHFRTNLNFRQLRRIVFELSDQAIDFAASGPVFIFIFESERASFSSAAA